MAMYIEKLMKDRKMTRADLSRKSCIPESTLRGILDSDVVISRCQAGTIACLANALGTTVEDILVKSCVQEIPLKNDSLPKFWRTSRMEDFCLQRRVVLDLLHCAGDRRFLCHVRRHRLIQQMEKKGDNSICLYTVALMDYLCRMHKLPLFQEYERYRTIILDEPIFPFFMMPCLDDPITCQTMKKILEKDAIPEFQRCNIFETEDNFRVKR